MIISKNHLPGFQTSLPISPSNHLPSLPSGLTARSRSNKRRASPPPPHDRPLVPIHPLSDAEPIPLHLPRPRRLPIRIPTPGPRHVRWPSWVLTETSNPYLRHGLHGSHRRDRLLLRRQCSLSIPAGLQIHCLRG